MHSLKHRLYSLLRQSEQYTKTDMVYLTSSTFWLNLNFVFVSGLSLLLSIAFAFYLPKEEYGVYQYILAIASFLTAFTFTGMNTAINQAVARGHAGVLRASLRPQLLWNLVPATLALLWSSYYFLQGANVLALGVLCVSITLPIINAYNSYAAFLLGSKRFREASLYAIGGNIAYYVCIFAGLVLFPTAIPLIAINVFLSAAIAFFLYQKTIRTFALKSECDPETKPFARHLTFMNVLNTVAAHMDKLLVFHFIGATALAAYGLATLLPERLAGAFKALLVAALPQFANRDMASIRSSIGLKLLLVTCVTVTCSLLYYLLAPVVLPLLYPAYAEIIPYSQLYALTFVSTVGHLTATALLAHKRLRKLYILNTGIPLFQIGAQVVGIVLWGLWGLIIARVLSSVLLALAGFVLLRLEPGPSAELPSDSSDQVI